jgi:hypothetical protein
MMNIETPHRLVKVKAKHLGMAIDAIKELMDELDEAKRYCDAEECKSIEARIGQLAALWDHLSEAIEDPGNEVDLLCPQCEQPVKGDLFVDPAGQYKGGICEYCWQHSI